MFIPTKRKQIVWEFNWDLLYHIHSTNVDICSLFDSKFKNAYFKAIWDQESNLAKDKIILNIWYFIYIEVIFRPSENVRLLIVRFSYIQEWNNALILHRLAIYFKT